jgi:hypothetical protein
VFIPEMDLIYIRYSIRFKTQNFKINENTYNDIYVPFMISVLFRKKESSINPYVPPYGSMYGGIVR